MRNDAIQALMAKGTMFRTNVHEKGMNMGDDICGAILNDLHRGLKQWKAQIGLWFSQQDADMIHAWIQAVLAKAERTTARQNVSNRSLP